MSAKHGNGRMNASSARSLSANMEDYLEAIFRLSEEGGPARVSRIADSLGVKRPSVSKALKRLQEQGLIRHSPYGGVDMTARGRKLASQQVRVHRVLTRFLTGVLGLPEDLAEHDACLIEHAISHETVERLVEFIDHLELEGAPGGIRAFRAKDRKPSARPVRPAARAWRSRV
ncbi:MAG: metal-dependent transcriptional regulator [Planctomycetota bacterium]|nr:metal-dependent transcriptional regulator [Planctomycetota bacterium]